MRDVIAWTLAILAAAIALPAQLLMFLAEWIGDKAEEWIAD
jgi:hypothetical protein